jgi:hypothetical protein
MCMYIYLQEYRTSVILHGLSISGSGNHGKWFWKFSISGAPAGRSGNGFHFFRRLESSRCNFRFAVQPSDRMETGSWQLFFPGWPLGRVLPENFNLSHPPRTTSTTTGTVVVVLVVCGPNGKRACFFPVIFQSFESLSVVKDRQTDALKGCGLSNLPVERIKLEIDTFIFQMATGTGLFSLQNLSSRALGACASQPAPAPTKVISWPISRRPSRARFPSTAATSAKVPAR